MTTAPRSHEGKRHHRATLDQRERDVMACEPERARAATRSPRRAASGQEPEPDRGTQVHPQPARRLGRAAGSMAPEPVGLASGDGAGDGDGDGGCPVCGFVIGSTPTDRMVSVVLRVPSRYRDALAGAEAPASSDGRAKDRSAATRWSVLEHVVHVADSFHMAARVAVAMLDGDTTPRSLVHVDAPRADANGLPLQVALGSLITATATLGRTVSAVDPARWDEPHETSGRMMTVRDVLEHVLHEAQHHLAELTAAPEARPRLDAAARPHVRVRPVRPE